MHHFDNYITSNIYRKELKSTRILNSDVDLYTSTINFENLLNTYRLAFKDVMNEIKVLRSFFGPKEEIVNLLESLVNIGDADEKAKKKYLVCLQSKVKYAKAAFSRDYG